MNEVIKGNLWDFHNGKNYICITTNGFVKKNGECVMGRGCAKECSNKYPWFPAYLGRLIKEKGNKVHVIGDIITLPVKHHWFEKADIELIVESMEDLYEISRKLDGDVYIPLPGCGNGGLDWELDVKDRIKHHMDDNMHLVTFG